ncbi:MAG: FAD-binding oxidoreductase [Alphaproteobacteria bacterium]|nr:FAD-binding oxidoreductase [Alphaproteobacteria bacterium]
MTPTLDPAIATALKQAVGARGWIEDQADIAPYLEEQRGYYRGATPLVLRPAGAEEVAAIVRICAAGGTPIVPQGGNTGMVGGAVPHEEGGQILVNLSRMNAIRAIDTFNNTMEVEAGCVLADIRAAAAAADRLFPLSLAAEGSCQIGGNLSTNAGGTNVLRYGNARSQVLGLEVVLPDGAIWNGLRGLRKDNTGYDLKHLFIGAEGTLGIITAAVLKLRPRPRATATAMIAARDPAAAVELLIQVQAASGEAVTAWELMPRRGVELTLANVPGNIDPLAAAHDWYVLAELGGGASGAPRAALETALAAAHEAGTVADAVIAASEAQAAALWRLRETMPEAQRVAGTGIRHDVAVPLSRIAAFIDSASARVRAAIADIGIIAYGHLGDGNIHFNLSPAAGADADAFATRRGELMGIVHDTAVAMGGTISAEHGIGRLKRDDIARYKSETELGLMRTLKRALDPGGIMNPGKVLRS